MMLCFRGNLLPTSAIAGVCFVKVDVYDNNVDQAIRVLKKKMNREGMFREMKKRKFFEKPSERRRRKEAEAFRRMKKKLRRAIASGGS